MTLPTRLYRTLQGMILAGLSLFLLMKLMDGSVLFYLNRRFIVLAMLAVALLAALAQEMLAGRPAAKNPPSTTRNSWQNLFWMAVPLVIGLAIPAKPLDSLAAAQRGIELRAPLTVNAAAKLVSFDLPASERTLLDWIRVFDLSNDPADYLNAPADVVGFVYHDPRQAGDQFMLVRFAVTCCVADATAVGLPVAWGSATTLNENGWVRVRGSITNLSFEGRRVPGILAESVEAVEEPRQPYLFP